MNNNQTISLKVYLCAISLLWFTGISTSDAAPTCEAYVPVSDGCTDLYMDQLSPVHDFESACDGHDVCYQTIGITRENCDKKFREDMVTACERDYLRFEAYQQIDIREVAEWGFFCAVLGIPTECWKKTTEAVFGWVEVSKELAERTVELPGYPVCMSDADMYYAGVRIGGGDGYKRGQTAASEHAERLAYNQEHGFCATIVEPQDSNLFASDDVAVTKALYANILHRDATEQEVSQTIELASIDPRWEYSLTYRLTNARNASILVPVLGLILN